VLYGVILLWFILTALSVAFVAIDIRTTPEATVMKWGFVLVTLFTGPFGAFLYVLGCREPLPGMHEVYVAARWRQALGSAMHCVAGDGVGILTGAVIAALLLLSPFADFLLEYVLGFLFGWGIFQALFMRAVIGGSYALSLRSTFIPELTSMNCLMAGMMVVTMIGKTNVPGGTNPSSPAFWFIMSMGLLVGLCATYPMNYWLVSRKLKPTSAPRTLMTMPAKKADNQSSISLIDEEEPLRRAMANFKPAKSGAMNRKRRYLRVGIVAVYSACTVPTPSKPRWAVSSR
jgi:hypothetical protein